VESGYACSAASGEKAAEGLGVVAGIAPAVVCILRRVRVEKRPHLDDHDTLRRDPLWRAVIG
jgi:hypothetical protein